MYNRQPFTNPEYGATLGDSAGCSDTVSEARSLFSIVAMLEFGLKFFPEYPRRRDLMKASIYVLQ
jgi:hypothetical protein